MDLMEKLVLWDKEYRYCKPPLGADCGKIVPHWDCVSHYSTEVHWNGKRVLTEKPKVVRDFLVLESSRPWVRQSQLCEPCVECISCWPYLNHDCTALIPPRGRGLTILQERIRSKFRKPGGLGNWQY